MRFPSKSRRRWKGDGGGVFLIRRTGACALFYVQFFFCFCFFFPPSRIYARRWRGHNSLPGRRLGSAEGQMLPTRRQLLSASLRSLPRTYVGCQGAAAVTGCSSSRGELMRADGAGCDRLIGRELRGPRPLRLEDVFFRSHVFQGTDRIRFSCSYFCGQGL